MPTLSWFGLVLTGWFGVFGFFIVSKGITLIVAPKSMSVFGKEIPLISTVTIGFLGSLYLYGISEINLDNCPTTLTRGGSFFFLLGFLIQRSLMILAYMGISLMACNRGIFIHTFHNSSSISLCKGGSGFLTNSLSGKGGRLTCWGTRID